MIVKRDLKKSLSQAERNNESGATLLEYTIVLLLLIPMMFAVLDFALVFNKWSNLRREVRQIANSVALATDVSSTCGTVLGSARTALNTILVARGVTAPDHTDGTVKILNYYNSLGNNYFNSNAVSGYTSGAGGVSGEQLDGVETGIIDTYETGYGAGSKSKDISLVQVYAKVPSGCFLCGFMPSGVELKVILRKELQDSHICYEDSNSSPAGEISPNRFSPYDNGTDSYDL